MEPEEARRRWRFQAVCTTLFCLMSIPVGVVFSMLAPQFTQGLAWVVVIVIVAAFPAGEIVGSLLADRSRR